MAKGSSYDVVWDPASFSYVEKPQAQDTSGLYIQGMTTNEGLKSALSVAGALCIADDFGSRPFTKAPTVAATSLLVSISEE